MYDWHGCMTFVFVRVVYLRGKLKSLPASYSERKSSSSKIEAGVKDKISICELTRVRNEIKEILSCLSKNQNCSASGCFSTCCNWRIIGE